MDEKIKLISWKKVTLIIILSGILGGFLGFIWFFTEKYLGKVAWIIIGFVFSIILSILNIRNIKNLSSYHSIGNNKEKKNHIILKMLSFFEFSIIRLIVGIVIIIWSVIWVYFEYWPFLLLPLIIGIIIYLFLILKKAKK